MAIRWNYVLVFLIYTFLFYQHVQSQYIDCGGEVTDQAGVITSPNFPQNYPDNSVCNWHITVAKNQVIDVRFTRLDLDRYSDQNCLDYVAFYDGPSDQYPIIESAIYCGYSNEENNLGILIRSTGNQMLVAFRSDGMGSRAGFSASYRALECAPFTYGRDSCENNCACNKTNTDYCHTLNGRCMCNSNWTRWDCSVLVDHCWDPNICSDPYGICVNVPGGYECRCKSGLTKNSTGQCDDPKTCTQTQCSHYCGVTSTNPRVETCYCPKGMKLNSTNSTQCEECPPWFFGDSCAYSTPCAQANTESYDKTNGLCHCYLNWTSTYCTEDFNECSFIKQPCVLEEDYASCYNTPGSFECRCLPGYEPVNETTCDACGKVIKEPSGNIISASHLQYTVSADYPECNWTIEALLGQLVSLSFSSYNLHDVWWYYPPGYIYIFDGNTTSSNLIWNSYGNWYLPGPNIIRTTQNMMLIIRYPSVYGHPTPGFTASYWTHECPPFMYDANCSSPCICNPNNTQSCNNLYGYCYCKSGWTGSDCNTDLDECSQNYFAQYLCPDYSNCHNLHGTYECICKPGLTVDHNICSFAVNSSSCTSRNCSHMCVRYMPENETSFIEQCYCPVGKELDGDLCIDCKNWKYGPDCEFETTCIKDHTSSYDSKFGYCKCNSNWTWTNCEYDYDECSYGKHNCHPNSDCYNYVGGYSCICKAQYGYIETSPNTCEHINCTFSFTNETGIIKNYFYDYWFVIRNANCSWVISVRNDYVISLRFSTFYLETYYGCQNRYFEIYDGESTLGRRIGRYCGSGIPSVIRSTGNKMFIKFVSDEYNYGNFYADYTSHICRNFTYGRESCDKNCKCVKENTQYCDSITGECMCKPGWTLGDCSTDVNECLGTNNKVCPPNSDCINTKGSYRCECHLGYKFNSTTGKCDESSDCTFKKCSHMCYIASLGIEQCVCPDGLVLDEETNLTCVVPYYPYGKEAKDSLLKNNYTSHGTVFVSKPIRFSTGAPFGDEHQTSAFVLSNGVIGFSDNAFELGGVTDIRSVSDLNIIAPYLAKMNPNLGQVYYHLYEKCGNKFGDIIEKQDSPKMDAVFARAEKDVKEFYALSNFDVNTVLVTTWVDVQPFSASANKKISEVNTFQAVYISGWETIKINGYDISLDEESAYVIFIYQYGKMKWTFVPGRSISIGTTGKNLNSLKDLDTKLVTLLDRVRGNTGYNGVVTFEVGRVNGPDQTCNRYVCNNADLLSNGIYQYEKEELYKCPCTLERLGNQWQLYEVRGFFEEIYCYAISPVAKRRLLRNNRRNELCCYTWIQPASDDWREWLRTWREATYISASPNSGHVLIRDPWDGNYFAIENLYMHQFCCNYYSKEKFCNRFYKLFPDRGCSNFVTFVPRSALGDPHITTLDGLTYTMNGYGEFILLLIRSENFILQCRTDRAEGVNGSLTNATVFTAFAVKESNESHFQVELSVSKTSMVITAGEIDITSEFYEDIKPAIIVSTDTLSVTREYNNNRTVVVAGFPSGVSIKVYVAAKSLLVEFNVPKEFQNATESLLGNFNGNMTDEFILPNGTILPAIISEREIYDKFAKAWMVNSTNSVFIYQQGESTDTYQHPEFEPFYMDEADPSALAKAKEFCGESNTACIYDYLVTGDKTFASETKVAVEKMDEVIISFENTPPSIQVKNESLESNGFWLVVNGTASVIQVIVDDVDGDAFVVEILGNVTGVSVNASGFITYMPDLRKPILLRVRAVDSKQGYSPDLYIPLLVCSGCNHHGFFDAKNVREEYENGKFKVLSCICHPAYTGQDCESEVDGCSIQPCIKGQTCTDLTAAQQGNSTTGYKCGPCPTGFQEFSNTCVDVDECLDNSTCDHLCMNTEGSYTCSCRTGFRLNKSDFRSCKDINECEERSSNCLHKCINNAGNYTCSCYTGYTLDADGYSCNLDESIKDKCYDCQQVCLAGENVTCGCRLGYEPKPDSKNDCQDIDECKYGNQPCSQICSNLDGSYECSCYNGYKLAADKVSCSACEVPNYGKDCLSTCQCNGRGVCSPIKGCVCSENWSGVNCEADVDECLEPTACALGLICLNTIGSFKCLCPSGYKMNSSQCIDINECTDPTVNITCDLNLEICVNNLGSYGCECKKGYAKNSNGICVDIDECSSGGDLCQQACENKAGSYNCLCYQGYLLDDDRKTCIKVKDPCANTNLNCSYGCRVNSNDVKECFCPRGFNLVEQQKCEDIDECASAETNLCSYKNGCVNTNGSFTCSCEAGTKLDNDNRSCKNCSSGTWGLQCANSCACSVGADHCDSKTGCVCKPGYKGTYCEEDIDECQNKLLACNGTEKCVNLPGTAVCKCLDGYDRVSGICTDVNECLDVSKNNCSQLCKNTEGSYECSCFAGYLYDSKTFSCNDIDECKLQTASCEKICINTDGSYRCSCPEDLLLQPDGFSCRASLPCVNITDCSFDCALINGSDTCLCPRGQMLGSDGKVCQDVDLCASSACLSGCVETKSNTSFECVCETGYVLENDGITCRKCDLKYYGPSCALACQCESNQDCDNVNGACHNKSESTTVSSSTTESITTTASITTTTDTTTTDSTTTTTTTDSTTTNTTTTDTTTTDSTTSDTTTSDTTTTDTTTTDSTTTTTTTDSTTTNTTTTDTTTTDSTTTDTTTTDTTTTDSTTTDTTTTDSTTTNTTTTDTTITDTTTTHSTTNDTSTTDTTTTHSTATDTTTVKPSTSCDSLKNVCNTTKHEICAIKEMGYGCVCQSGYLRYNSTSDCTEVSAINCSTTFNWDVSKVNLDDENGTEYIFIKNELETKLAKKLKEKGVDVMSVTVKKLSKGSLIVDYIVSINKISSSDPQTTLTSALLVIKSEGIELNGTTILVTSVFILNDSPATCEIRQLTNPCKSNEFCVVEGSYAVCKLANSNEDQTRLTLGLAIGLPLFALLCAVVAVFIWKKSSGQKKKILDSSLYLQSRAFSNSSATFYTNEDSKEAWNKEIK